jgi:uncharacterized protein
LKLVSIFESFVVIIFLYTFIGFVLFFLLLAIGYIIQHKVIHGSCGGLGTVGIERECSCEKPCFTRRIKNHLEERKKAKNKDQSAQ